MEDEAIAMPQTQEEQEINYEVAKDKFEAKIMQEINKELHLYCQKIAREITGYTIDYVQSAERDEVVWVKKKDAEQLITQEGANHLMQVIERYINPVIVFSNITDDEVKILTRLVNQEIINFIKLNYEKYRIPSEKWETLLHITTQAAFFMLKRAMNAGERSFYKTVHRSYEHAQTGYQPAFSQGQGQVPQRKGFFRKLFNM